MRIIKKTIICMGDTVLGLALLTVVSFLLCYLYGLKPYITMSGSMEPQICTGSLCFVDTKTEYKDVKENDIIAFETTSGGLVTHRAINISDSGIETKGDANETSDGISVTPENFRGKNVFLIPYLGYGIKYLQKPQTIIILLIFIVSIILFGIVDKGKENDEPSSR